MHLIHSGFPVSISDVLGGALFGLARSFPASSPGHIFRQTVCHYRTETKGDKKTTLRFNRHGPRAVVDGDYKMGLQIQANISKLESHNFV